MLEGIQVLGRGLAKHVPRTQRDCASRYNACTPSSAATYGLAPVKLVGSRDAVTLDTSSGTVSEQSSSLTPPARTPFTAPRHTLAGMEDPTVEWIPAQDHPKTGADMRASAGPVKRGYKVGFSSTANTTKTQPLVKAASKRKRDEPEDGMDVDGVDADSYGPPDTKKRNTVSRDISGLASNRAWKVPAAARHSASKQVGSTKSWDKKVRAHACSQPFACPVGGHLRTPQGPAEPLSRPHTWRRLPTSCTLVRTCLALGGPRKTCVRHRFAAS